MPQITYEESNSAHGCIWLQKRSQRGGSSNVQAQSSVSIQNIISETKERRDERRGGGVNQQKKGGAINDKKRREQKSKWRPLAPEKTVKNEH